MSATLHMHMVWQTVLPWQAAEEARAELADVKFNST
jgi:hypothetical protein